MRTTHPEAPAKMSKIAAEETAKNMRQQGWPGARIKCTDDGLYVIITHAATCRCNICPVLLNNGQVSG